MKAKLLEETNERIRVLIEGASIPLVNSIRRACYTEVPVMAIEYVEFFENNTVLYDEVIAHRLAMIPLDSEEAIHRYDPPEKCKDAEPTDSRCYAVLELDVETGPKEQRVVYSGDLRSLDPYVKPVYNNIPIVIMAPEQKLHLRAYARLGYGKEHAKWMPVTVAYHKYLPVIHFDLSKDTTGECIECISRAAPWLAEKMKSMGRGSIEILEDVNTSGIYWCTLKKCGEAARMEYRSDKLILTIESAGQLRPRLILFKAIDALERKTINLLNQLKDLKAKAGGES